MKKFVIYTAVFGKASRFRMPKISHPDVEKICFTDLELEDDFYEKRKMNLDPFISVRQQRFIKICIPDEIFDNYEYSFYLDYKHPTTINFDWLMSCMEYGTDFLVPRHKERDCIYDEAIKCINKRKGNKEDISRQINFYKKIHYPEHNGLYATYWLFRRHTERLKELSSLWWEQLEKYSHRDQISLPYVIWDYSMKISSCGKAK